MVRRGARSLHPADHSSRCGTRSSPRRRWSAARRRVATAFAFSENPEPARPARPSTTRTATGIPVMAAAQDLELVVSMHVGSSSTMPTISSDAPGLANLTFGAIAHVGHDALVAVQRLFERMPGPQDRAVRRQHRLDARTSSSAPSRSSTSSGTGRRTPRRFHEQRRRDRAADGRPRPPRRAGARSATTSSAASSRSRRASRSLDDHRRGQRDARDRLPAQRHHVARLHRVVRTASATCPRDQYKSCAATPSALPLHAGHRLAMPDRAARRSSSTASCAWAAACASSTPGTFAHDDEPRRSSSTRR